MFKDESIFEDAQESCAKYGLDGSLAMLKTENIQIFIEGKGRKPFIKTI